MPGLNVDANDEIVRLARALSGLSDTGSVSYGTEAGLFEQAGIPSVICGPGSIAQAHKPNEWVALDQLARCEQFIDGVIDRVAG
jgi:acetylornithine deacetylase